MRLSTININDAHQYLQRNSSHVALGLSVLMLVLVISYIIFATLDKRSTKAKDYAPQNVKPLIQQSADRGIRSDIVSRANLFGNAAPAVVAAPKTTLNLTLKGILSANVANYARAIIQVGNQPSELYSVGEAIKGAGAKLEEIRMNEVLLNRAGAIESLPLLKAGNTKGADISFSKADDEVDETFLSQPSPLMTEDETLAAARPQQAGRDPEAAERRRERQDSPNGERRKIKRPSFSGLDRAIKKAEEI